MVPSKDDPYFTPPKDDPPVAFEGDLMNVITQDIIIITCVLCTSLYISL